MKIVMKMIIFILQEMNKIIKSYQILTQYKIYSVNHLTRKNQTLNDLSNKQLKYNQETEKILKEKKR